MTKTVYITDIKEINTVKIVCSCGAKFDIPIDVRNPPQECFACNNNLDWRPIDRCIKGILGLKQAVLDGKYLAYIETEEKDK